MRQLDVPPVWLIGSIFLAWLIGRLDPLHLSFRANWVDLPAGILIGGGVILTALALSELRRQNTTFVPHRDPDRLVTSGIFKRSRNPIYLGDVMMLAGFILLFDAPLALPLIPLFLNLLERRFVLPEEDRLRRKFRVDFARYAERTRRWI